MPLSGVTAPADADSGPPILDWPESALRSPLGMGAALTDREVVIGELAAWLGGGESVHEPGKVHPGWSWDWFYTLTFDPADKVRNLVGGASHTHVGWSLSDRRFREWEQGIAAQLPPGAAYWVRSRERNPDRPGTHFHGLMGGVGNLRRDRAWREWFERNGMARIVPLSEANSREAVVRYVTKYVLKDQGEMTFSPSLGLHRKETQP